MLKKKIVLITGVGKGIGLSCLKLCIENNAFVIGVTRFVELVIKTSSAL